MKGLEQLFVTWQDRASRRIFPVARLRVLPSGQYELSYLRAVRAAEAHGFRGLPGYEELERAHLSRELPELFAPRHAARPREFSSDKGEPANDRVDIAPVTVFVTRPEDSKPERLEVFAPPLEAGGRCFGVFVARGVNQVPNAEQLVPSLEPGETLEVRAEPHNPVSADALRLMRADGAAVGYVPEYLASEVGGAKRSLGGTEHEQFSAAVERVARINHPPAAPLYQVTCRYWCSERLGRALFRSSAYEPLAASAPERPLNRRS